MNQINQIIDYLESRPKQIKTTIKNATKAHGAGWRYAGELEALIEIAIDRLKEISEKEKSF